EGGDEPTCRGGDGEGGRCDFFEGGGGEPEGRPEQGREGAGGGDDAGDGGEPRHAAAVHGGGEGGDEEGAEAGGDTEREAGAPDRGGVAAPEVLPEQTQREPDEQEP